MCPQYTELGRLRELYPPVPIIALTATANKRTVADIISQLKLRDDHAAFTQSFNRTNLRYIVHEKKGSLIDNIVSSLQTKYRGQAGVIYCHARRTCEQVAESLQKKGIVAAFFHAKMPTEEKDQTVRDWQAGEVPVIVATVSAVFVSISCFFLNPSLRLRSAWVSTRQMVCRFLVNFLSFVHNWLCIVRFVIHYDLPKSLSGYYQETGRAGRDGNPADCIMCKQNSS